MKEGRREGDKFLFITYYFITPSFHHLSTITSSPHHPITHQPSPHHPIIPSSHHPSPHHSFMF
ncbi:MAG: hypothetical protein QNJ51_05240 [Calothrix sp. MO_167.B12]|nr:hypothetical protein [Calothrix sp. MO_167.B12]